MPLHRVRLEYAARSLLESRSPAVPPAPCRPMAAPAPRDRPPGPNPVAPATADARGRPHPGKVGPEGAGPPGFKFYTNQVSAKGRELARHPDAALVMWWP